MPMHKNQKIEHPRKDSAPVPHRPPMRRFLLAVTLLLFSTSLHASSLNSIKKIDVSGEKTSRTVKIHTGNEPVFTVFRLSNPMRIVIDISSGDFTSVKGPISIDDGTIGEIATQQFNSNGLVVGRVIIGFERNVNYVVTPDKNSVIVTTTNADIGTNSAAPPPIAPVDRAAIERFEKAKKEVKEKQEALDKKQRLLQQQQKQVQTDVTAARMESQMAKKALSSVSEKEKVLESEISKLQGEKTRLEGERTILKEEQVRLAEERKSLKKELSSLSQQPTATLSNLKKIINEGNPAILIEMDKDASYEVQRLDSPPRLILDIHNTTRKSKTKAFSFPSTKTKGIRLGDHTTFVRAVFDLETPTALHEIQNTDKGIQVTIRTTISQAEIKALKQDRKSLEAEKNTLSNTRKLLEKQQNAAQSQIETAKQEAERLETQRSTLKRQEEEAQKALIEAQAAHKKALAMIESAETKNDKINQEKKNAAKEVKEAQLDKQLAKDNLELAQTKEQDLERRLEVLATQHQKLATERMALLKDQKAVQKERKSFEIAQKEKEANIPPPARLLGIDSEEGKLNSKVIIKTSSKITYAVKRIDNPPRIIIDLHNTKQVGTKNNYNLNRSYVSKLRFGNHKDFVRAVLVLPSPNVTHQIEDAPEGIQIRLQEAKSPSDIAEIQKAIESATKAIAAAEKEKNERKRTEVALNKAEKLIKTKETEALSAQQAIEQARTERQKAINATQKARVQLKDQIKRVAAAEVEQRNKEELSRNIKHNLTLSQDEAKSAVAVAQKEKERADQAVKQAHDARQKIDEQEARVKRILKNAKRERSNVVIANQRTQEMQEKLAIKETKLQRTLNLVDQERRRATEASEDATLARQELKNTELKSQKAVAFANAEKSKSDLEKRDALMQVKVAVKREKELEKKLETLQNENNHLDKKLRSIAEVQKKLVRQQAYLAKKKQDAEATKKRPSIFGIKRTGTGTNAKILLQLTASTNYKVSRIENPPRLIIDLPGATRTTSRYSYNVKSPHIKKVRFGDHPDSVRAVIELNSSEIKHDVRTVGNGILISTTAKPASRVAIAAKTQAPKKKSSSSIKPTAPPKTVSVSKTAKATKATKASKIFKNIHFEKWNQTARITLDVDPVSLPKVDTRSDKSWVITLKNVHIPKDQERSLDTSAYDSIVKMVSTYKDKDNPNVVKVVANLDGKARQTLTRSKNKLIWEITPRSQKVRVSTTAPRTAGFARKSRPKVKSTSKKSRAGSRLMSIDVKDADIGNVLRLISEISGQNIIAGDEVKGKVTLRLRNVPWDHALDTILRTKGYSTVSRNNILRIAPIAALNTENKVEFERKKARIMLEDSKIKVIALNYAVATDIVTQIQPMLTERGSAQADVRTNTIVVEDVESNLGRLVALSKRLDSQTPQVLIESRIVEASSAHVRSLGIQWGGLGQMTSDFGNPTGLVFPGNVRVQGAGSSSSTPTNGNSNPARYAVNLPSPAGGILGAGLGFTFGSAGGGQLLNLRLTAMEESGNGRVISSPRITTLDNRQAIIKQGISIPVSVVSQAGTETQFFEANLELDVTPHVTNDGSILMEIKTSKDEPDFSQTGAAGDPTIKKKSAKTEVLVKDGDTTVIGGIYTRNVSAREAGVPILSRIPILGVIFRREEKRDDRTELLIFITPRIVNRDEALVNSPKL